MLNHNLIGGASHVHRELTECVYEARNRRVLVLKDENMGLAAELVNDYKKNVAVVLVQVCVKKFERMRAVSCGKRDSTGRYGRRLMWSSLVAAALAITFSVRGQYTES